MLKIEFIYDQDCPNIDAGRQNLIKALAELNLPKTWTEWERNDSLSPNYARRYGSPTILLDGKDINNFNPTKEANSCRVYVDKNGIMQGVPSIDLIRDALQKNIFPKNKGTYARLMALIPVIGAAILPKLTCPACWPAYAAILGYFGIGFVNYTPLLLPMTLMFVSLILFSLIFRASKRRGYLPFFFGILASSILVIGKFIFDSDVTMYAGLGLLIASSVWNSWPLKTTNLDCPSCVSTDSLNSKQENNHEKS